MQIIGHLSIGTLCALASGVIRIKLGRENKQWVAVETSQDVEIYRAGRKPSRNELLDGLHREAGITPALREEVRIEQIS
jgi:hypothetical protein